MTPLYNTTKVLWEQKHYLHGRVKQTEVINLFVDTPTIQKSDIVM